MIRDAVAAGSQVHVWPAPFQTAIASATVRSRGGTFHVERSGADPVAALRAALIEADRLGRDAVRVEAAQKDARQVDVEDLIEDDEDDCAVCESGGQGCDACRSSADEIGDLIG